MSAPGRWFGTSTADIGLSRQLRAALRPLGLLAGVGAGGVALMYLIGLVGILPALGWQLLAGALLLGFMAWAHLRIARIALNGQNTRAYWLHAGVTIAISIGLALLWNGATLVCTLMVWIPPMLLIPARLPRPRLIAPVALSAFATILIIVIASLPGVLRLPSNTTGSFAARLLVISTLVLFILLFTATQVRRYHTLESRLVGSLLPIIIVPILFATAIGAYSAFQSSQQQFQNTLEAAASLKAGQLESLAQSATTDLNSVAGGARNAPSIMHVLQRLGSDDTNFRLNSSLAATQIRDFISKHPGLEYEEVLVLDTQGNAVLSTYLLNQGISLADQAFFQQGRSSPAARFVRYPGRQNSTGEYKLVAAVPFYGTASGEPLGVVVGVVRPTEVLNILMPTMGLEDVSTYVVDSDLSVLSTSPLPEGSAQAEVLQQVTQHRAGSGSAVYRNHAGASVLGYYSWNPILQATVVAEIAQSAVIARALIGMLASGLFGLLTMLLATIAVLAVSRTISEPLSGLARDAESLATGHLTIRAVAEGEDELGRLTAAFNSMADQLQGALSELERRVSDRTRELESQITRLRTAAEVARDASRALTLDDLLNRASTLVLDRFAADHVGIFLLDEKRQYAVLQASPSDVGQRMLADNYRVLVGDRGAIGQVAATGERQLLLKGRQGGGELGDEYHANSKSRLCLPLRTREGTIGTLDLQSDSAAAFTPADAAIMQLLADLLAAAIEQSRLLLRSQERVAQLEHTYPPFSRELWPAYFRSEQRPIGYRSDHVRLDPVSSMPEDARVALESDRVHLTSAGAGVGGQIAYVPIRLRDQSLGVISAHFREGQPSAGIMTLLGQAAERLGTALDNARLIEDSLRRAARERLIGQMTAKIGSSISIRSVLQTAVEELGRAIPGSEVSIKFRTETPTAGKDIPK